LAKLFLESCYFLATSRDTQSKCGEQHLFSGECFENKKNKSLKTLQIIFRFHTSEKFGTKKNVGCNLLVLECWSQGPKIIKHGILF
jgi:hypothetical protein